MIDTMLHSLDLIHEVTLVDAIYPNTIADQPPYTGIRLPAENSNVSVLEEVDDWCLGCDQLDCICDRGRD
jgi:hypothetical protein